MKILAVLILLAIATVSQAAEQSVYCYEGAKAFTATVVETPGTPGYFQLKNAKMSGAFINTDFICAGNTLFLNTKCAGYMNNIASKLIEVSFQKSDSGFLASFKTLANNESENWACVLE